MPWVCLMLLSSVGRKRDNMEVASPAPDNLQCCANYLLQHVRNSRSRVPSGVRYVWGAFRSTYWAGRLLKASACVRCCSVLNELFCRSIKYVFIDNDNSDGSAAQLYACNLEDHSQL